MNIGEYKLHLYIIHAQLLLVFLNWVASAWSQFLENCSNSVSDHWIIGEPCVDLISVYIIIPIFTWMVTCDIYRLSLMKVIPKQWREVCRAIEGASCMQWVWWVQSRQAMNRYRVVTYTSKCTKNVPVLMAYLPLVSMATRTFLVLFELLSGLLTYLSRAWGKTRYKVRGRRYH